MFLRSAVRPRLLQPTLFARQTHALAPSPRTTLLQRLAKPVHAYGRSQRKHPWLTQIATGIVINFLSDINAQILFPSEGSYDGARTLRMVATSAILAIPVNEWYTRVSTAFSTLPKAAAVAVRVGLSQAIFSPLFLVGFFGLQAALEGKDVMERIRRTPKAWLDGMVLWPAVSVVNFWWVPLEYRALVGGVVSLGWGTWLSYLNSRETKTVVMVVDDAVEKVVEKVAAKEESVKLKQVA